MTAPVLVFGWGNASRGDDALGPLFVERLRATHACRHDIDWLDDYQLQVEHALDLAGRERVLFVDASVSAQAPWEVSSPVPGRDTSLSTHALSPQALLVVYQRVHGTDPPPCTLLAIRGQAFELGAAPSAEALANLADALAWAEGWLAGRVNTR